MDDSLFVIQCIVPLVFGVIFGLAAKSIFESKGRNGTNGFWLGFILGIFGLVIAFVLPPEGAAKQVVVSNARFKTCPYCAEQILEQAIVCKHCGKDVG